MTKLAPEWVRTSDPVIRRPARYRWTTAPAVGRDEASDRREKPSIGEESAVEVCTHGCHKIYHIFLFCVHICALVAVYYLDMPPLYAHVICCDHYRMSN